MSLLGHQKTICVGGTAGGWHVLPRTASMEYDGVRRSPRPWPQRGEGGAPMNARY